MGPGHGAVRIEFDRPIEVSHGFAQLAFIFASSSAVVPTQREAIVKLYGAGVIADGAGEVFLRVARISATVISLGIARVEGDGPIEIADRAVDVAGLSWDRVIAALTGKASPAS